MDKRANLRSLVFLGVVGALLALSLTSAFAVTSVTVSPGWQSATNEYASWTLSAHDTSSGDDFKFTYGDGGSVTWTNVGSHSYWLEFENRTFPYACSSRNFYQKLDHLNGPGYDTSTTYVAGHNPC
ncbi:MAG: hypothetical protein QNL12_03310 [Acidimicrobiia bacterium]|nr:hypothetical protein [Acidimicrobiia bacterium]